MYIKPLLVPGLVVMFLSCASGAHAVPILGDQLFYTGGDVTVESLPVSSGFASELGLYDATFTRVLHIMDDEPPGVIVTFDPADYGFIAGDELFFGIRVISDSDREYFMGPAIRNPDGVLHAGVDNLGGGIFVVGFEDLFGGGDLDYDDNRFQFEGAVTPTAAVPEPATLSLVGLGLVAARRYRRRSK
jgi:PEP-CTERM motif